MDPDLIHEFIIRGEVYDFRLLVIKWLFYGSAAFLMVVVLLLLWEDFFSDR